MAWKRAKEWYKTSKELLTEYHSNPIVEIPASIAISAGYGLYQLADYFQTTPLLVGGLVLASQILRMTGHFPLTIGPIDTQLPEGVLNFFAVTTAVGGGGQIIKRGVHKVGSILEKRAERSYQRGSRRYRY